MLPRPSIAQLYALSSQSVTGTSMQVIDSDVANENSERLLKNPSLSSELPLSSS